MIYMVVVVSKHFISAYFPHKESAKPLGVQVREATEEVVEKAVVVEVEVVVSQYRANLPCLSSCSVGSDGISWEASSTLNIYILRNEGPKSFSPYILNFQKYPPPNCARGDKKESKMT